MVAYSFITILAFGFTQPTVSETHLEKIFKLAVAEGAFHERLREFEAGRGTPEILIEALRVRLASELH